jgi:ATP-dependent exoDNAse (exonuclease V) alpha subunit
LASIRKMGKGEARAADNGPSCCDDGQGATGPGLSSATDPACRRTFDGRSVTYGFGELDMLVPAYAATIHKSQGSEYPAVVIPVLTQHYAMLQRNLLYTGVTRGKRLVVLVGQKKAVAIAVRNASGRRRWSKLAEWLSGIAPKRG